MSTATDLAEMFLKNQKPNHEHEIKMQTQINDHQIKKAAVINTATEQFRSLLETHFESISKAAQDGFIDDEAQTEPKAKVSFAVEWDSLALAPTINVKCGWSVRYKDESETMIDPLQAKLGLDAEDNS
jgi:inhibitor of KinA sporulation pathway (predicted exonuclease)